MDLAVVIPAYQTDPKILKRCIDSVIGQTLNHKVEIVVVESFFTERSSVFDGYNMVRFLFPGRRMFAGEARNFGAMQTSAAILAFLDSDCVWNPNWLSTAEKFTSSHPNWRAANGQVLFEMPQETLAFALHILEFHEFLGQSVHHPRFLPSGNLLIQRKFFNEVGGFKADWPACEDIGFLVTLQQFEKHMTGVWFIPALSITHLSHLVDADEIQKKIFFMGYWRGFYDQKFPDSFQISNGILFQLFKPVWGIVFFVVIMMRSIKHRSIYLWPLLRHPGRIMLLCLRWADGFRKGVKESAHSKPPTVDKNLFPLNEKI